MTVNTDMTGNRTLTIEGGVLSDDVARLFSGWDPWPTEPNEALIRQVLAFIEMHAERWNQDEFLSVGECGTAGCFAGWAAMLSAFDDLQALDEFMAGSAAQAARLYRTKINKTHSRYLLGLTVRQFVEIYGFVNVHDPDTGQLRHPTFAELCERVKDSTGIDYKAPMDVT
jgi:hypothetical protein